MVQKPFRVTVEAHEASFTECSPDGIDVSIASSKPPTRAWLQGDAADMDRLTDGIAICRHWQTSSDEWLLERLLREGHLGSGADMGTRRLQYLFLQVNVFYFYKRTRVIPKSVPEPTGPLQRVFAFCVFELSSVLSVLKSRLLLAGDVEENSGPLSKELELELIKTLRGLPKMLQSKEMLAK